ncbi:hypothetical protein C4K13_1957 [Pseudomonas chlororaphis subsp. aureofaciens]|nr:hypothetical protein C4K13_1957 [Pseudomonas chlororaphis subsp. aureofaciens]
MLVTASCAIDNCNRWFRPKGYTTHVQLAVAGIRPYVNIRESIAIEINTTGYRSAISLITRHHDPLLGDTLGYVLYINSARIGFSKNNIRIGIISCPPLLCISLPVGSSIKFIAISGVDKICQAIAIDIPDPTNITKTCRLSTHPRCVQCETTVVRLQPFSFKPNRAFRVTCLRPTKNHKYIFSVMHSYISIPITIGIPNTTNRLNLIKSQ